MNRHCYRVIFNKTLARLVVVSEKTSSSGKSSNPSTKGSTPASASLSKDSRLATGFGLKALTVSLLFGIVGDLALVQTANANTTPTQNPTTIIADPNANKHLQPIILPTASGIVSVNIQSPNDKGLSNNHYRQFDVGNQGVVLNNNRKAVQTQLAGFVQANPYMAKGEATTILNQINSNHPSHLNGFLEVAGQKADVIIANPSGLVINGVGFINAGQVHLAAANSEVKQGKIAGHQVGVGSVTVDGVGLDNRQADFTQVIARHVKLDAPILADELQLVVGDHRSNNDTVVTTSIQGNNTAMGRTIAVDVSELGGMYAGKITLINTEIDTLVNNKGQIFSGIGGLTLDHQGNLVNAGTISSQGKTNLVAKDVINSGTLSSKEQASFTAQNLDNSGLILTADTLQVRVDNTISNRPSAQINAAHLDIESKHLSNDGTINQTGTQALSVVAQGKLINAGNIGYADTASMDIKDASNTSSLPPEATTAVATPSTATGQGVSQIVSNSPQAKALATGTIKTTEDIDNIGKIQANGDIDLSASVLNNDGKLHLRHLDVVGSTLKNTANIQAKTADIQTDVVDNSNAKIVASQMLSMTTNQLDNTQGKLHSTKDAHLQVAQRINNAKGEILADGSLRLHDNLNNSLVLANTDGIIIAKDVSIQAKSLDNQGKLSAIKDLSLQLDDGLSVDRGLQAGNTLIIKTNHSIDNQSSIQAGSAIKLYATQNINNQGVINSQGLTYLHAKQHLNNVGVGRIYGNHVALSANTLVNTDKDDASAVVAARTRLDIGAAKILNQTQHKTAQGSDGHSKLLSEGTLHIGGSLDDNHQAIGKSDSLDNLSANIESNGDMFIASAKTTNKNLHLDTQIEQVGGEESKRTIGFSNRTSGEHGPGDWGWNLKEKLPDEYDPSKFQFDGLDYIYLKNEDGSTVGLGRIWIENDDKLRHYKTLVTYTDPSVIKSGGQISFDGHVDNVDSTILAQGNILNANGDILNDSTDGVSYTLRNRNSIHRDWYHDGGLFGGGYTRDDWYSNTKNEKVHEKTFELPTTSMLKHQNVDQLIGNTQNINLASRQTDISVNDAVVATLPSSSLYTINPSHPGYVVQTDPAFTNYKQWLSSDYMLKALQSDPDLTHKQIGDGYYQQRLIAEQIAQLTGRHYLPNYSNQEEQFKSLMEAGIEFAKKFNMTAGTALTQEQMSKLTKPMVWLQLKDLNLGDGSRQKVYYPIVLLPSRHMTLQADGALISGKNVIVDGAKLVKNKGALLAQEDLVLSSDDVYLQGGSLQGKRIRVLANQNIHNQAKIHAEESLKLQAGQDISMTATTGLNSTTPAQIYVGKQQIDTKDSSLTSDCQSVGQTKCPNSDTPSTNLVMTAGRDLSLNNTHINNESQGTSIIKAGRNLSVGTVSTTHTHKTKWGRGEQQQTKTTQHGSHINTQGDLLLQSANDLDITGSSINGESTVLLDAKNIKVNHATQTDEYQDKFHTKNSKFLSSSSTKSQSKYISTTATGSQITGAKVALSATDDIAITGSQLVSDDGTHLNAGKDIHIQSATNTLKSELGFSHGKSGLMNSGGVGFSIGKQTNNQTTVQQRTTHVGSTVGSLQGDVTMNAGNNYQQTASIILAAQGDIAITAKQVDITAADNAYSTHNQTEYEKKGVTLAVNVPVVNAVQTAINSAKTLGKSSNDRINAMATVNAGWQTYQAGKALANTSKAISEIAKSGLGNANELAQISATVTYAKQKNTSQTLTQGTTAEASQVFAGGVVKIQATSKGDPNTTSNINITGSDVLGKSGTYLIADNNVNIKAHEQHHSERSSNKSQGYNAGVAISYGQNGFAFGATAGGNYGKGYGNADELTHRTSHVGDLASQTVITTGNKLTVQGGQVKGSGITISADDLHLSSVQDTATYTGKQQNIQAQATVGYGVSLNANYNQSKINADHQSVTTQSGIFAGDDGFNINIKNHSQLDGAIITSTKKAEQEGKNSFSTGTIDTTILKNHSIYDAKSFGFGAGMSVSGKTLGQQAPTPNSKLQTVAVANNFSNNGIGYGKDGDNQSSITQGGIYTDNIIITDTTKQAKLTDIPIHDTIDEVKTHHSTDEFADKNWQAIEGLDNSFNVDRVQKELDLQVQVTQSFDNNRRQIRSHYAQKAQDYRKQAESLAADDPNKPKLQDKANKIEQNLRVFDGITSALYAPNSNGIMGDVARTLSPQIAYEIGQYFKANDTLNQIDNGNRDGEGSAKHLLAHALLGAAVSYATGNDVTTGALSAVGSEAAAPALSNYLYGTKDPETLTQEQKDTITSILSLTTAATIYTATDGNIADAVSAAEVGKVGVENNWGGADWAYTVGGGTEHAQNQASLGAYCTSRGEDYATCMGWKKENLWDKAVKLNNHYNDMTILSISQGGIEQTFIVNNKNGNIYASVLGVNISYDDIMNAKTVMSIKGGRTPGGSVSFGSVVSGRRLEADEVDKAIAGLSFSAQACYFACVGSSVTADGTRINTFGGGTPGAGVSTNYMVKLPFHLTKQELESLLKVKKK